MTSDSSSIGKEGCVLLRAASIESSPCVEGIYRCRISYAVDCMALDSEYRIGYSY
jgi:hypothetical protein